MTLSKLSYKGISTGTAFLKIYRALIKLSMAIGVLKMGPDSHTRYNMFFPPHNIQLHNNSKYFVQV